VTVPAGANPYAMAPLPVASDPTRFSDAGTPPGAAGSWDNTGWAQKITRDDYAGTPDPTRTDELPRHDARANLRNPWGWWANRDAETAQRESVVTQDADGWTEKKGTRGRGPDPRWFPPAESRLTSQLAPRSYYFERPFDQTIARRLTGAHISLANNRRNYDILTMTPVPHRRNTYRVEPGPWDTDIVDEAPSPTTGRPSERLEPVPITPGLTTRSYRLG
jgi:hypothetical protein